MHGMRAWAVAVGLAGVLTLWPGGAGGEAVCEGQRADAEGAPQDEYAWIALGRCLLSSGAVDAAVEALRKAVEVAPDNVQAYDELGIAYVRKGLLEEAWQLYRRVQQHGLPTGVHQVLAEEYLQAGEWEKAELELRHTVGLGHYDQATLDQCRELALRYLEAGQRARAKALLRMVFDLRPTDERAADALQRIFLEEGAGEEAEIVQIRYLLAVMEGRYAIASARLRDDRTRLRLAELQEKLGRLEDARSTLVEAVEVNGDVDVPLAVEARMRLAAVYCKLGLTQRASEQWERVVQLEPANAHARERLQRPEGARCRS